MSAALIAAARAFVAAYDASDMRLFDHVDAIRSALSAAESQPATIAQPLTDADLLKIAREAVQGSTIKLTRDVGPYEVTEPTHAYRCLADALVAAACIGAQEQP